MIKTGICYPTVEDRIWCIWILFIFMHKLSNTYIGKFTNFSICHPIGTKLLNQFLQSAHGLTPQSRR